MTNPPDVSADVGFDFSVDLNVDLSASILENTVYLPLHYALALGFSTFGWYLIVEKDRDYNSYRHFKLVADSTIPLPKNPRFTKLERKFNKKYKKIKNI